MRRSILPVVLGTLAALAWTGCGGDGSSKAETGDAVTASTDTGARERGEASARGVSVKVMRSRYGEVIFDGAGRALYLFTRERTSRSRCYGACARAWPPFLTPARPRARTGVRSKLLGTTKRRDGRLQVTYRGHPLYYYVTDRKPGQITCQDIAEFGGTWLVVSPSGRAVR